MNAYHQVPLSKESMLCTGFTIPGKGQAVWTVLFFGTKGAVTFFQKVIELALGNLTGSMVIVIYVDNILVGSLEVELHVRELVKVIEALMSAGLKLKPAKCKFGYEAIGFMGAILSGENKELGVLSKERERENNKRFLVTQRKPKLKTLGD